ncbi:MAG: hypothetical protein ACRDZX_18090, partial [Acidimicrobiales bacterium]
MLRARTLLAVTAVALVGAGCGSAATRSSAPKPVTAHSSSALPTIKIGSENFTEEIILGDLYNDVLQHAGFKTNLRSDLG